MPILSVSFSPFQIPSRADGLRGCGLPASETARIPSPPCGCGFGYRQVCNDRSQKWRAENPGYWKRYRQTHLDTTARNRTLQQTRDQKRRVRDLANNNLALDLKSCAAGVWLFGPAASHLANNTLATTQVFIVEGLSQRPRNLANNSALASAPVLPDNRISPQPC